MKKILIAASIATLAFAGCKNNTPASDAGAANDSVAVRVPSNQVVYIDIDSLMQGYDMYLDLRGEYETKARKVEGDITSRGRGLEKDIMDFQNKVQKGLVTTATAQNMQADLEKRQQAFMEHRERSIAQISEEERVMLNQIQYSITEYLKEFNADMRYGMIISTTAVGPILNADPMLDITKDVLAGLNKKYAADKAAAKPAAK